MPSTALGKERSRRLSSVSTGTVFSILFLVLLVFFVLAATETLNVSGCGVPGGSTCSDAGLNSDDTSADGANLKKGAAVTAPWTDTTFAAGSTITKVDFIMTHSGASGIDGNLGVVLRNAANTVTYCSFSYANSVGSVKRTTDTTASCAWTKARLDDLVIVVTNNAVANKNAYLSFLDVSITYTPPDTTKPTIALDSPGTDTWDVDGTVLFKYKPTDNVGFRNCTLYIDGAYNKANATPIVNNTLNNFTVIGLSDGTRAWKVNCTDTAGNTNVSASWNVKIDTTGPVVELQRPVNDNVNTSSSIDFKYNATDAQRGLTECKLYVNGTLKDTKNAPAETTWLTSTVDLVNGYYLWWVNCTDDSGHTTKSPVRNLTVSTSTPTIAPDAPLNVLGENVTIHGENFDPSVQITLNYTLPNGTNVTRTVNTGVDGTFNHVFFIEYFYPNGTFTVYAFQTLDPAKNATTTFTGDLPSVTIAVSPSSGRQGDTIAYTGSLFSPSGTANVTVTFNGGSKDSFLVATNTTGGFTASRQLSYTAAVGAATVFAYDTAYPKLNDSDSLTVLQRVADLRTALATYGRNDDVVITGYNFTRNGTVDLRLYDNTTKVNATGYPKNKIADDTGHFTDTWNTGSTCNGVYGVSGYDLNHTILNDTTYFAIDEWEESQETALPVAGAKSVGGGTWTAMTISNINASGGGTETMSSNTQTTYIYQVNWTTSYNSQLRIANVIARFDHSESPTYFTSGSITYWNGATYANTGCTVTISATLHADECNITQFFDTPAELQQASLRLNLVRTVGGASSTTSLDYALLNITTQYEPACTYLNGTPGGGLGEDPPFINAVSLEDDLVVPASELDLTAGAQKTLQCNVTVQDPNGYADIDGVNATLYASTSSLGAADNNLDHYTNASCTRSSGSGIFANYTCNFRVWYYAVNGTWTCSATANDGTSTSTLTDTSEMNKLYALNISPVELDYGDVAKGETSAERQANVTNYGNAPIGVSVYGYGAAQGDGLSFDCVSESIALGAERYAASSGPYDGKTELTSSFVATGVSVWPTTTGAASKNATYWQVRIPTTGDPSGECTGVIVFQAET